MIGWYRIVQPQSLIGNHSISSVPAYFVVLRQILATHNHFPNLTREGIYIMDYSADIVPAATDHR